ncbi:unnamed protein product [Linum trigynum]|uniref:Uncharacterized protein n=1 Tax=Linum trigynum TaxID=586398 RepID=A0AAV2GDP3_9ROSI
MTSSKTRRRSDDIGLANRGRNLLEGLNLSQIAKVATTASEGFLTHVREPWGSYASIGFSIDEKMTVEGWED